jgi:hypothetical protein
MRDRGTKKKMERKDRGRSQRKKRFLNREDTKNAMSFRMELRVSVSPW